MAPDPTSTVNRVAPQFPSTLPELIEYCVTNVPPEVRESLPLEAEASPCLMRCGQCYEGAMLAIDGDLCCGEDHETILRDAGMDLDL